MRQIKRSPISTIAVVRILAVTVGVLMLLSALRFATALPDVMPGNAAGMLALVTLGTLLIVGAIWLGI
ncbi:hypothetical protein [Acetobacter conturbans]|uniref:Uncharacterized protein n=1 Tax=Acetobacter conturbans TaxID=1737472 RepID=A0ABX0K0J7_9PROT|nr:hypothetical protein [Acetobacter conturbans]NHN88210.1 hypothetical protein [Acetobacter conturbans]